MRIKHLEEGVIKVPEDMLERGIELMLQVISTTIIRNTKRGKYLEGSHVGIYKDYDVEFKDYGNKLNALNSEGDRVTSKLRTHELSIPYGKKDHYILINLHFDANLTNMNGYFMKISINSGTVVISLHDILKAAKHGIQIDDFYDDDLDARNNLKTDIFPMDFQMALLPLVRKAIGTLEHEYAHAIQNLVIRHKDQIKTNKGYDAIGSEYWKSEVEFSPQIITAARNFEAYIESLNIVPPSQRMKIFMYVIGEKTFPELGIDTNHTIDILNNSRIFFSILKAQKPKAFKKAVKILYDELQRRDAFTK